MSIIKADLDEIVFRFRNKDYGAYVLRKEYTRNTRNAMIIGISIFVFAIVFPVIWNMIAPGFSDDSATIAETIATLEEPPPMDEEQEQPEEVKVEPPPPPQRSQIQFVPPEVVAHEDAPAEVTIVPIDSLKLEADVGTKNIEGDADAPPSVVVVEEGTGTKPVEVVAPPKDPDPDEFMAVEKEATPVNMDEIRKIIVYPEICKQMNIEGKVFVRVMVGKDGKVAKHIIKRSPHELMTKEVEKHLSKLSFTPGIQAGRPITMWVSIPFEFKMR